MPRRVEPKSELVYRAAKARARSYLFADGNGLALRVQPNGTKTLAVPFSTTARKRTAEGAFHLVAQRWLDFKRKEWADETYRKAELIVREYLNPALRNKPISTLATPEVKPVLEAIASHAPNLATKARQYVGGIVTYAVQNGLREDGAALTLRGVVPRNKKGHIPAITRPAGIASLVRAIDAYKSPVTCAALKLTMLTGLRPRSGCRSAVGRGEPQDS